MQYIITSGIGGIEESRHIFSSDIAAREFVKSDYDFMTDLELDKLFTEGQVTWPQQFDSLDWIRLKVTE